METILHRLLLIVCLLTPVTAHAGELTAGPRLEITHPGKGHEVQLSGQRSPSIARAVCLWRGSDMKGKRTIYMWGVQARKQARPCA